MEDRHLCKARPIGTRKQWVTGFYAVLGEKTVIIEKEPEKYHDIEAGKISCGNEIVEVMPETVCQCTGLKDKNGNLIWENDIVDFLGHRGIVKFECGSFGIAYEKHIDWDEIQANIMPLTGCENTLYACENDNYISLWEIYWNFNDEDDSLSTVEVIGNIFDNPELLEV